MMLEKLDFLLEKYEDLGIKVSDPDVINDQSTWQKLVKEHSSLQPIVEKYKEYRDTVASQRKQRKSFMIRLLMKS